ncbi:hypothetical protein JCM30197_17580 [Schleiferia thermophila]|nr:hypothetical protein JCM30197_17580 [Schleiferia thermophila]
MESIFTIITALFVPGASIIKKIFPFEEIGVKFIPELARFIKLTGLELLYVSIESIEIIVELFNVILFNLIL